MDSGNLNGAKVSIMFIQRIDEVEDLQQKLSLKGPCKVTSPPLGK
jgi:hypothetical protein